MKSMEMYNYVYLQGLFSFLFLLTTKVSTAFLLRTPEQKKKKNFTYKTYILSFFLMYVIYNKTFGY